MAPTRRDASGTDPGPRQPSRGAASRQRGAAPDAHAEDPVGGAGRRRVGDLDAHERPHPGAGARGTPPGRAPGRAPPACRPGSTTSTRPTSRAAAAASPTRSSPSVTRTRMRPSQNRGPPRQRDRHDVADPRPHARITHVHLGAQQDPDADRQQVPPQRHGQPLVEPGRPDVAGGRGTDARPRDPRVASPAVPGPVDASPHRSPHRRAAPAVPGRRAAHPARPGAAGAGGYAHRRRRGRPALHGRRRPRRPASGRSSAPASRSRCRPGYAGFVHPRSGLAARAGLSVVNAPGTIDAGYRGRDPRVPDQPRSARGAAAAPRRPDRAARRAAGRAGAVRRGRRSCPARARGGRARVHRRTRAAGAGEAR